MNPHPIPIPIPNPNPNPNPLLLLLARGARRLQLVTREAGHVELLDLEIQGRYIGEI